MNRRELVLSLVLFPLLAGNANAQQGRRVPRIGYLSGSSRENDQEMFAAFRQGLRDLGYEDGRSIVIEQRYAGGQPAGIVPLAEELIRNRPDVLVVYSVAAAAVAVKLTGTIPIVGTNITDPISAGLAASLARPGGNLTGLADAHPGMVGKRLELLKEIVPSATRIAVLWNPQNPTHPAQLKDLRAVAPKLGVTILALEVRVPDDIERAFAAIGREGATAVFLVGDYVLTTQQKRIAGLALKQRLPAIYTLQPFADAGGLISYGTNFAVMWRSAATYVDKILKGAKPGDLPIEEPTRFELVVNRRTAKALGIAVPNTILLRADRVIE